MTAESILTTESANRHYLTSTLEDSPFRFFTPYYFFRKRKREVMGDFHNLDDIQEAADQIAEGRVIIANMCGAIGFVIDGTNENAIDKVFEIKGRIKKDGPLVVGGSLATRKRLIDQARWGREYLTHEYDLPHFFEHPVHEDLVADGVGKYSERWGRVAVIFWSNFYLPTAFLEVTLQARNNEGFLVGSSANFHNLPPVQNSNEAFQTFGRRKGMVDKILVDKQMESERPFSGSQVILGIGENDEVKVYRGGSITLRSYLPLYPNLRIPDGWRDPVNAVNVDVTTVRKSASYFRNKLSKVS